MAGKKKDFESSFASLKACAAALNDPDIRIEKAIENYKAGIEHYKVCSDILREAEQLIEVYDRETDRLKEMQEM